MVGDSNASSLPKKAGAKSGAIPLPMDPLAFMDIPNLPTLRLDDQQQPQQGPSQVGEACFPAIFHLSTKDGN